MVSKNNVTPNPADDGGQNPKQYAGSPEGDAPPAANAAPISDGERRQAEKTKTNWTELFAFVAAIGGVLAAIFSGYQGWVARDSEKRQLRAYVSFSTTNPLKMSGSELTVIIDNFGQTPAKNVHIWSSWQFVPFGDDLPADFQFLVKSPCGGTPPKQSMLPGPVTIYPKNPYPAFSFHCPFDLLDIQRAERNEANAFIYGFISYFDIFDEEHRTNFCYLWYPAIQKALLCNRHNETDPKEHYQ